jgi:hypothetical protein
LKFQQRRVYPIFENYGGVNLASKSRGARGRKPVVFRISIKPKPELMLHQGSNTEAYDFVWVKRRQGDNKRRA